MDVTGVVIMMVAFANVAVAWPYDANARSGDDYSTWRLARSSRRSHQYCVGSGSKCFSTAECCQGLVCAAFDDYFGQRGHRSEDVNPETPGFCVKEKDLQTCHSTRECDPNSKCASLGHGGVTYCISQPEPSIQELINELPDINVPTGNQFLVRRGKGSTGTKCKDNSDCKPFDKVGGSPLCCQRVSMGRTGVKTICDRITAISKCRIG